MRSFFFTNVFSYASRQRVCEHAYTRTRRDLLNRAAVLGLKCTTRLEVVPGATAMQRLAWREGALVDDVREAGVRHELVEHDLRPD